MSRRPIVYGARYYFPGSRVSHSHLYRLQPDGTGRQQLTFGKSDDTNPAWSPDGKWIAFSRSWQNDTHPSAICLIRADGGAVRTVFPQANAWNLWAAWLTNTHLLVHSHRDKKPAHVAFVVKIAMGQAEHTFLKTWETALSPKRTRLTAWSDGDGADVPTRVLDLSDGHELVLPKEVGGTCAWLAEERFVALSGAKLITCSRAGEVLHSVAIRRDALAQAWVSKFGDENAGTSFLNPFPGRTDCVLVGWQLGGSQQGSWAATYRVDLKTGSATPWAVTDTIVASPDNRFFLTTRPRDLVEIPGGGSEWASPLLRGKVADPANQQPLVSGRVKVEGFDWRKS